MAHKLPIAVLISGRGSNMLALAHACAAPDYPARIVAVISNRPDAAGLAAAAELGLPVTIVDHKAFADKPSFEKSLNKAIQDAGAELVCLAGFMRLLSEKFVESWSNRLVNIHPSLLPAFKGLDTHERALATGVRITGCTVHFVRPAMDDGPILMQAAVPIVRTDTPDTLASRILEIEHKIYPAAVRCIAEGRVTLIDEIVHISDVDDGTVDDGTVDEDTGAGADGRKETPQPSLFSPDI